MNRRNWLKSSALLAGGLGLSSTLPTNFAQASNQVAARLYAPYDDEVALLAKMPKLKARISSNENPFGPSKKAKEALMGEIDTSFRYGRESKTMFAELLAEHFELTEVEETRWGKRPTQIMLGAGSTELLLAASLAYGQKGGKILSADPTYMSLIRRSQALGAEWDTVPLTKDYVHDLDRLADSVSDDHSLVYICNPNNPTATVCDPDELRAFCKEVSKKKPVFVDEAYIDYTSDPKKYSMADLVADGYNVIIARTFSKLHAFAGLRIGYTLAQPDAIATMSLYSNSAGNISSPSAAAAIASFQDTEYHAYAKKMNQKSKGFLLKTLADAGYEHIPSTTNFVLFPLRTNSEQFRQDMLKRGVSVRSWSFDNKEWCRVSIGTMQDMEYFAEAFNELV